MDDGEHDILHFVLEDESFPTFTNIAFVFPKGQLSTLTEPVLVKTVMPFFTISLGRGSAQPYAQKAVDQPTGPLKPTYVLEGIGLRMSINQVRAAAKAAGSVKGLVRQGPTTYNLRTRDLDFQIEFDNTGNVYQYNVSALNPRHLRESEKSGPLYDCLTQAFGPPNSWGQPVVLDMGETGGAYAIVSDSSHSQ